MLREVRGYERRAVGFEGAGMSGQLSRSIFGCEEGGPRQFGEEAGGHVMIHKQCLLVGRCMAFIIERFIERCSSGSVCMKDNPPWKDVMMMKDETIFRIFIDIY
mmetsp:Transcript_22524/g.54455  ORF Transcript_22524/g.54455 Transcript_22524/m.54455 type:complete len:104 (+) Transcript_22524:282-593(+)